MDFNFSELKQDTHHSMNNPLDLNLGVDKVNSAAPPDHSPKEGSEGKKSTGSSLDDDWLVHVDDSKITEQAADDFGDFLTTAKHNVGDFGKTFGENLDKTEKAGNTFMSDMTRDFMNAERGLFGSAPAPAPVVAAEKKDEIKPMAPKVVAAPIEPKPIIPSAPVHDDYSDDEDDDDHETVKRQDEQKSSGKFYDDFADNDSPSISYNPSPIKKNPVTTALKEQENEKFISSEDLLGDFKEERTATPELKHSTAVTKNLASSGLAEEVSDLLGDFKKPPTVVETKKHEPIPTPIKPPSYVEEVKEKEVAPAPALPKAAPPVPAHAPSSLPPAVPARKAPTPTVTPKQSPTVAGPKIVSVEEIFYKYGLDVWFKPERLHPRVESLIYWRDVKKSGIVFGAGLITLLAIACFSVISVFAYLSIIALSGTVAFRIYKTVMAAVQKTSEGHPFKEYLEFDLTISQERVQQVTSVAVAHVNGFTAELRRLFLVDDLVDSLKFGVILWFMTYIGAWFNGMTLVMLAFVSLFTLPKLYESNKQSIDSYLDLVRTKVTEITDKVKVAIPIGKKAPIESEKDK